MKHLGAIGVISAVLGLLMILMSSWPVLGVTSS